MNIKEAIEHCWDRKDYPEVFRDDAGLDISIPGFITRSSWFIDNEIPIFKGEDREYIEKLIA